MTEAEEVLLYSREGAIARLTLNRPEKRNAQNLAMLRELSAALARADADPEVRVIVLNGAGPCFSAGHDLAENANDPEVSRLRASAETRLELERLLYWQPALDLRDVGKPTIAQVHGHCIAAGLMLAAMCDLVVAADDATFSDPVLRMGAAGVELPVELWAFGPKRAKEFLFSGRTIDAQTAYEWGFINRLVLRERLEAEVAELAAQMAAMPPQAVRLTKLSINRSLGLVGMDASFEQHFQVHQVSHATDESRRLLEERRQAGGMKRYVAEPGSTNAKG
jgi:enoyl-CoA hydratase/carnithine racemase